jgi:hypothetical protein
MSGQTAGHAMQIHMSPFLLERLHAARKATRKGVTCVTLTPVTLTPQRGELNMCCTWCTADGTVSHQLGACKLPVVLCTARTAVKLLR